MLSLTSRNPGATMPLGPNLWTAFQNKQAKLECASEGSLGKDGFGFFLSFCLLVKTKHLNKRVIRHQFKCFIHYNVNVSYATHPFQSLKSPTCFSVAFERKMPFFKRKKKCFENGEKNGLSFCQFFVSFPRGHYFFNCCLNQ